MIKLRIKGHEIEGAATTTSFNRRAQMFKNSAISALEKIGVERGQINIPLEILAGKKLKAHAEWFAKGHRMYYSCKTQERFVDNLQVVSRIIEKESRLVLSGEKTMREFITEFEEDEDVEEKRLEAREFFGLEGDSHDIEIVNKKYKGLAKELHPDTPTGNTEKFKKLNHAHKILKRELT